MSLSLKVKEVIFFSNNKNKVEEVENLFYGSKIKIFNLNNFSATISPKETGNSFKKNANIKSLYGFKKFNLMCFADDSGICIEALNGEPGVNSKNYLKKKSKREIFKFIINQTKIKKKFNAFFQTTICLSRSKNNHIFFTGRIDGKIADKIVGKRGFGYDPIFIPNGYRKTFAEMNIEEKNKISHRGIALVKLKKFFEINLLY